MNKTILWIGALIVGAILGLLGLDWLNQLMDFVATVYTLERFGQGLYTYLIIYVTHHFRSRHHWCCALHHRCPG